MATIEERAKSAFEREFNKVDVWDVTFHNGYIQGATDQRKIDIDKACEAHCSLCGIRIDGICKAYKSEDDCYDIRFIKKAMEE